MRGVVSAGMVAALERLGNARCLRHRSSGSSAGAINGAALLSGVAAARRRRLLRAAGVAVVREPDARAAGQAGDRRQRRADDRHRGRRRRPRARHLRRYRAALHRDRRGHRPRASTCTGCARRRRSGPRSSPRAGCPGREDRRWRSTGAATSTAGWFHRSRSPRRSPPAPRTCSRCRRARSAFRARARHAIGDRLIERHLRGLNPALVTVYRERIGIYEQLVDDLARRSGDHASARRTCSACGRRRARRASGQLERDPVVLTAGATDGERLVEAALGVGGRQASVAPAVALPGPR